MSAPRPVGDYLARDYESLLTAMRQLIPDTLPEWTDFTDEADPGNVLLQLFAHLGDVLSYYQDRVAAESLLGTARTRRSAIDHLRLIGYQLATAAPAATELTVSVAGTVRDTVTLRRGDAFATRSSRDGTPVRFEYLGNPRTIDFGTLTPDPATGRRVTLPFPVEEGRLFTDERIGTATGRPDQRYPIPHPRVVVRPPGSAGPASGDVLVHTRHGAANPVRWYLQETLAFSGPGDRHFVLEIDADDQATVVFGNGSSGRRPESGDEIVMTYRTGGGRRGNVAPFTIDTIVGATPLALVGAKVANPRPATGGEDRETIEHAVRHAPAVFRSLHRAVTAADYEALAATFPGVAKVLALEGGWNRVCLVVAPAQDGLVTTADLHVSDVLEKALRVHLEDKRMLGQVVEICEADPVEIRVTVEVGVTPYVVEAEVLAAVRTATARLLAFVAVGFGDEVYLSAFYDRAQDVPGVTFVNITEFRRADAAVPVEGSGRIKLAPRELPVVPADPAYAGGVQVVSAPRAAGG